MTSVQDHESTALVTVVETELAEPVATISRRLWAGTTLLAVVLVVAGTWGWFGRWSQHLDATAVIVHGTGPVTVVAADAGTLMTVAVDVGDTVRAGTTIATVGASSGARHAIVAGTSGTVLSIAAAGTHVDSATAVAQLDPSSQQAHAYLLISDTDALARLAVGQPVALSSPAGAVSGRVTGVRPTPTTTAALAQRLVLPLQHPTTTPVWLVDVSLDPGSPVIVQTQAAARVQLPSLRVYRVLLGDGS